MNKYVFMIIATLLVIVIGCLDSSDAQEGSNEAEDNQINETITNETDVEEESDPIITVSKLSEDEQFELTVKINTETSIIYRSIRNLSGADVEIVSAMPRVDVRANNTEYEFNAKRVVTNLQNVETITEETVYSHVTGENKLNVLAKFSIEDHGEDYEIEINDIEVDFKGDDADF